MRRTLFFMVLWVKIIFVSAHTYQQTQDLRDSLISYAKTLLNKPYRSGSKGPNGFDCSGFTHFVFQRFGVPLGESSRDQVYDGTEVSTTQLKKGDLVFFKGSNSKRDRIGHVGIVTGKGNDGSFNFIHAAFDGGVRIDNSSEPYYAKRFVTACCVLSHDSLYHFHEVNVPASSDLLVYNNDNPVELADVQYHKVKKGESLYLLAHKYHVSENELKQWNHLSDKTIQPGDEIVVKDGATTSGESTQSKEKVTRKIVHRVHRGESIYSIAHAYHVTEKQIKEWNHLSSNEIKPGQKLIIRKTVEYSVSTERKQVQHHKGTDELQPEEALQNRSTAGEESVVRTETVKKTHRVRSGESLYTIAHQYHTTVPALKRLNRMKRSTLQPGETIVVGISTKKVKVVSTSKQGLSKPSTHQNDLTNETPVNNTSSSTPSQVESKGNLNGAKDSVASPHHFILQLKEHPEHTTGDVKLDTLTTTYDAVEKHVVRPGETFESIAELYHVTINEIKGWNGIPRRQKNPVVGKELLIQVTKKAFVVVSKPIHSAKKDEHNELSSSSELKESANSKDEYDNQHVVKKEETVYSIANQHHLSVESLRFYNHLKPNEKLKENQVLQLKPSSESKNNQSATKKYVVKAGDTLSSVAKAFHTSAKALKALNDLPKDELNIGQELLVPDSVKDVE
ncbi:MAG: LysM peptidoglycan-binding domain-containing protein [Microbacter sp.]